MREINLNTDKIKEQKKKNGDFIRRRVLSVAREVIDEKRDAVEREAGKVRQNFLLCC